MSSCESSLLGLSEMLLDVAVEVELSNVPNRYEFLRPHFSRIEDVEVKIMFLWFLESLDAELPFWEYAMTDSFVEVFTVEFAILASQFQRFIPHEGVNAKGWCKMEFRRMSLAPRVGEGVGTDTEPLNHSVGPRNATIWHSAHEHMSGFGV